MSVAVEVDSELKAKMNKLNHELLSLGRLLVAYSGGVDSAFLAWAAYQVIPGKMLAVISDSPSLARTQLRDAIAFCEEYGTPCHRISTGEMQLPEYV